jgi:hypothetical protein
MPSLLASTQTPHQLFSKSQDLAPCKLKQQINQQIKTVLENRKDTNPPIKVQNPNHGGL